MSMYPCGRCGRRTPGRLASLYSAWFLADGRRTAWKQRVCVECVATGLRALLASAGEASDSLVMCPACGVDSSGSLDPIYLTVYLPKQEAREFALTTCASCAVTLRLSLQERAERLPDREQGFTRAEVGADEWLSVLA